MIEVVGLKVGTVSFYLGEGGLGENVSSHVLDHGTGDFVNEADIPVFAGNDARDNFAPGDLGIDNGFTATPAIIDHHNEVLHAVPATENRTPTLFLKTRT